jgi:mRNA interferase RelE/StbE
MPWKIEFSVEADRELRKLDPQHARRILKFLQDRVAKLGDPRSIGKALQGSRLGEFWRYIGRIRAVHTANPSSGTASTPASRKVSRTNWCRSFSANRCTSVTALNSLDSTLLRMRSTVYASDFTSPGARETLSVCTKPRGVPQHAISQRVIRCAWFVCRCSHRTPPDIA